MQIGILVGLLVGFMLWGFGSITYGAGYRAAVTHAAEFVQAEAAP